LENSFKIINFEKAFNMRVRILPFLRFFNKMFERRFLINFKAKANDLTIKINKIISFYKMFRKKKNLKVYLQKIALIQKHIKNCIFKKRLIKIIKIQSSVRKM